MFNWRENNYDEIKDDKYINRYSTYRYQIDVDSINHF